MPIANPNSSPGLAAGWSPGAPPGLDGSTCKYKGRRVDKEQVEVLQVDIAAHKERGGQQGPSEGQDKRGLGAERSTSSCQAHDGPDDESS